MYDIELLVELYDDPDQFLALRANATIEGGQE
jgi:hypothetical protein